MYLFGTVLLVASIAMALLATVGYALVVVRNQRAALFYGRFGVFASFVGVTLVWTLMVTLFLARRFDIDYVNNYSSSDLSFFFTVAATWAGQPGSFLIWTLWGAVVAVLLVQRSKHFEPYVLAVVMAVQAMLLVFTLILNPFVPTLDSTTGAAIFPLDGRGLNPLLHNFWMIIHPPILFVAYALAVAPFAFAIGALLRYDYDTWVKRAMPWALASWAFLGLALLLGGYWAYETLGWGGYWGWDPVENSSLVPWLLTTALLHGMLLQRTHGGLRRINLLLAILVYISVFYATFLTRSGVYSNFSVHSFVAEGIYTTLLTFLIVLTVSSLTLLAFRWRDIPARPLSDKFFSRDSFFVLSILSIIVIALVVTLGTSMPVISAIPGVGYSLQDVLGRTFEIDDGTLLGNEPFTDGRFSLAPSFYQRTTPPLGIVAVVLMIIGPLLGWRDANMRHLLRALRWPAAVAVLATSVAIVLGVRDALALAYVGLGVFAAGTNLMMIIRLLRSGWLRIGGYLAHIGFSVMLIGVVGSSVYATPDERVSMATGETVGIYGFDVTFNEWKQMPDGRGVIDLTVNDGSGSFTAQPELYFNQQMGGTMQTPAIRSYLWRDLYISPASYVPAEDPARPVMGVGDTRTMGPYELTFDSFEINSAAMMSGGDIEVGAKVTVVYEGETTTVMPLIRVVSSDDGSQQSLERAPAELPGGAQLNLAELDPGQRLVLLEGTGPELDGLPVQPAKAVVMVSIKPLVVLVWIGVAIGVIGGSTALLRRYLESQSLLNGERIRLPKGFGERFAWRGTVR